MKVTIYYNKDGQTFHPDNLGEVYAASTSEADRHIFLIKRGRSGTTASFLLNPNNMWHAEGSENSFDKRTGRNVYELTKVTKDCFDYYIKFLQTKNLAYLRNAEREIQ